jgi:ATP-binding cassette, subfamily B, bacterial CvaB/MchF/RaxB
MANVLTGLFQFKKPMPLILQNEAAECGAASLAMILGYYGNHINLREVKAYLKTSIKGNSLDEIRDAAISLNMHARALQLEVSELSMLQSPAILHWDMNHFVVLKKATKRFCWIHDPAKGTVKMRTTDVKKHFTGIALVLTPLHSFQKKKAVTGLRLSDLWEHLSGFSAFMIQIFGLSLCLEVFALVSPFYIQLVIDDGLVARNVSLLWVLCLGFLLIKLINALTEAARSWLIVYLRSNMGVQLTFNLATHLLRLPMNFFENRHIGDVLSRFNAMESIVQQLTHGIIEGVVDGLMVIGTFVMMLFYDVKLTCVVLFFFVIYLIFRLVIFKPYKAFTEQELVMDAKADSLFIEAVRGIQSLKVFNKTAQRQQVWEHRYIDKINATVRTDKLNIFSDMFETLLTGFEYVVVIFLGAIAVIHNHFSVGMLMAFLAYRGQFAGKSKLFVSKLVLFKMLSLYLYRVSDIALSEQEKHLADKHLLNASKTQGALSVSNISFRYLETEDFMFQQLNLKVDAGESVVLIGPSGCGKSTLMKIMMGLLAPVKGEVLLDGEEIYQLGLEGYRGVTAAVMQDDRLFAGSILENISFFDVTPDTKWAIECAKRAYIHQDIEAMPMGYNSLVGDMGSTLSGGQQQRIMLARALYAKPKVLFLDEATSSLDVKSEAHVNEAIKALGITRISIAHRQETIAAADRAIDVSEMAEKG